MRKRMIFLIASALITLTGCNQAINESNSNNSSDAADTVTSEINEEKPYSQQSPVQDYQKVYAEFLNAIEGNSDANIIYINEDDVPELSVQQDTANAYLYGFDGNDMYEIGVIGVDSNTIDFLYRPYLSMFSYHSGSVMRGDRHKIIHIVGEENGRLTLKDEVHIAADDRIDEAEYDINGYDYGESWEKPDDNTRVTENMIQYWLNN